VKLKKLLAARNNSQPDPQQDHIRAELWRLLGLLRAATGPGMAEEFGAILRDLAEHGYDIERGIAAWIGALEILVQGSEQRHPDGAGTLKKAEVKSAMHYVLSSSRFEIPSVPRYLQPVVIDFFVDWSIDALVSAANGYHLWTPDPPEPPSLRSFLTGVLDRLLQVTRPLLEGVAGLFAAIYVQLRYWAPLSPELRAALDKVKEEGLIANKQDLMRRGTQLVIFVGEHGPQVTAMFQLVFEAVREAEFIATLSGPDKKTYAVNLIMEVLEELGFPVDTPLFSAIARAIIGGAIESALDIFKKRAPETFQPSATPATQPASA
jgi:hypothetical protein